MDATEAKKLLSKIPEKDFITNSYTDYKGKCCAIGHLMRLTSKNPKDYSIYNCADLNVFSTEPDADAYVDYRVREFARITTQEFLKNKFNEFADLSAVNNTKCVNGYKSESIKERVLHLLDDMIEAGY